MMKRRMDQRMIYEVSSFTFRTSEDKLEVKTKSGRGCVAAHSVDCLSRKARSYDTRRRLGELNSASLDVKY